MKQNNTVQTGFKFLVIALVTLSLQVVSNSCTTSNFSKEAGSENLILVCGDSKVLLVDYVDSLYSAHGVVWDAKRKSLFALGYDVLREYKMENKVKLGLIEEWEIPGISGHDLQMAPDGNKLFITEHTGAWVFDLKNKEFSKIDKFPDAENIKSINQNKSGQFAYTVPEESWWTYHVRLHNPSGVLSFPDMRVYKARWFEGN